MPPRFLSLLLASLMLLIVVSGCPPRTQPRQQVAGKQENYQAGTPIKVTITFADYGMTIDPSRIPPGDIQLSLVNNSSRNQTFSLSGGNMRANTWTLQRGQTVTATVKNSSPGVYKLQLTAPGKATKPATR